MQSINVFENGIRYLSECLGLYLGGTAYMVLFAVAALYIIFRGNDEEKEIFLPMTAILLLTVYNPITPVIIDKFFDISSEYYRFFWITPVIITVPFVISKIIAQFGKKKDRALAIIFVILLLGISGRFVYENGIDLAENIYKIPDELIEISEIIHQDCDKEYPKAFFEYEYNMEIRQYDPKMLLTIDREEYIYAVNYSYTDEMILDDETPNNRLLAAFVRNQDVSPEAINAALEMTGTEYVVLTKGNPKMMLLQKAGLSLVGDTATHCIYRYSAQEPYVYELIDYTGVEHRFSYRRLK